MPEGDTVWRAARLLDRALAGKVLTGASLRVPQWATADLVGATVVGTVSRGKHLLTRIDADEPLTLHTHLKMEGAWQAYHTGEEWRRPVHTARVVLETPDRTAVGFSLGVVDLLRRDEEDTVVGHLGPDLLGPDWDEDEALRRLRADPAAPFVQAAQDQRNMAGIGNMYANELAFLSGVAPRTPLASVQDLPRVVRRARQLLVLNKERPQQATTGDLRPGRRTWVYRQRSCRRCGTAIRVTEVGPEGRERATYWCPSCQPEA